MSWPAVEMPQYGEIIFFNIVGVLTGVLADRLRADRNRYKHAAAQLQEAYAHLEARTEDRLRVDRLVTVGRLASGVAHEVSNPLGGIAGLSRDP